MQADAVGADLRNLTTCPYQELSAQPSKDRAQNCVATNVHELDPQNTEIWVFGRFDIEKKLLESRKPLGFYISAKASSEVYFNGQLLGQNGVPHIDKSLEKPGLMDAVFYIPRSALRPKTDIGKSVNEFAIRMSSNRGFLLLSHPVHFIGLAEYQDSTQRALSHYWLSLLPFGALLIGAFYMGLLALVKHNHWSLMLLPIMSFIGATQLYTEVYRGLHAYYYPLHDLRLLTILACSMIFGLCLSAHVIWSINIKAKLKWFLLTTLVTSLAIGIANGFDLKSMLALLLPASISLLLAASRIRLNEPKVLPIVVSLTIFLLCLALSPTDFLDFTFFYFLALLLVILFVNEIHAYANERRAHLEEQSRAERLASIISQHSEKDSAQTIKVGSAGKLEIIKVSDIVYCKAAGDYLELTLNDGQFVLHNERLTEMENLLPSVFLKVHRSYIVNTRFISSLSRKPSGIGELLMQGGQRLPVSRRIMPSVRDKLS